VVVEACKEEEAFAVDFLGRQRLKDAAKRR
jgi:hypothetical protein